MSTLVRSLTFWTTGSSALRVQVHDADSGAVIQARAAAGISEDVAGSGIYRYSQSLADAPAYEIIWDAGGAVFDAASSTADLYVPPAAGGGGTITEIINPVPALVPSAGASAAPGTFYIKRHDTREPLIYQALEGSQPVNLTGATLLAKMRVAPNDLAGLVFSKAAHIAPPPASDPLADMAANGWMLYQWNESLPHTDTAVSGTYFFEIEATFPDGRVKTFPTTSDVKREYVTIVVVDDLDNA